MPPEPFRDGIVVFGISGAALERARNDHALVDAVTALLKAGTRLSLQKNKLVAGIGSSNAAKSKDALSFYVGSAAMRIERLIGVCANDVIGSDRLSQPYAFYAAVSVMAFAACYSLLESSLTPLRIAGYSLALGLVLAGAAVLFVIPAHLRKNALGGAAVYGAVLSAFIGSIFLASSAAMIGNTYAGEKLLQVQDVQMSGTIVLTRGKHTSCWPYPDHLSSTLVHGLSLERLPLKCNEAHYHSDPTSHLYDVELNPGLQGAPFVQSIRPVDNAQSG